MSLTPLSLQNYDFKNPAQAKQYQFQLMQFLNGFLSQFNTFQGQASAQIAALQVLTTPKVVDLGTVSGGAGQSVNCLGALNVFIRMESSTTQTVTLTLSNVLQGSSILVTVNQTGSSTTLTLKLAATDTNGNTFTAVGINTSTGASSNLVTTGAAFGSGVGIQGDGMLFGVAGFAGTSATPRLEMLVA